MSVQTVIDRLDHCRQTGKDQWIARCPAHSDNGPSLSIKESSDGRILVHCFAGCGALEVITSIGLDWGDLFPPDDQYRAEKKHYQRSVDELVVEIAMADLHAGKLMNRDDRMRCREAMERIESGEEGPGDEREQILACANHVGTRESQRIKILGEAQRNGLSMMQTRYWTQS